MGAPEIGPITTALGEAEEGKPPAIIREWYDKLHHPGNFVFLWAAATRRSDSRCHGWLNMVTHFGEEEPAPDLVTTTPGANVEVMFSPLAHEGRIRIMQALWPGPLTASGLTAATGFTGGGLYHHLKELKYASYITDRESGYNLTPLGRQLLLTVTCLASQVVVDRGEEGLAVAPAWD
jgi:DNA-binding transcriptional ArsR family regulator